MDDVEKKDLQMFFKVLARDIRQPNFQNLGETYSKSYFVLFCKGAEVRILASPKC